MTPQPQQDRCVLTRHDVQSIKDLVFVVGGNSESSAQKAIFEILANNMRRPHPNTPSASDIKKQIKEIRELAQFTKQAWDERESTIRKDERNQTLDNILKFVCAYEDFIGLDNIDGFEIYGVKSVNLKEHIETLRHQSTEARK